MKKLLTILAVSSFSSFLAQITINSNLPSSFSAGNSYNADVKINKGAVGNFAKYQMDVPTGFVVSSVDVKGGNYTFENNRAKIVWVSVPGDAEFTVKLKVQVGSDAAAGTISQKFFYLDNNEKKEVEAVPINATLGGAIASTPAANTPVATNNTTIEPVKTTTEATPVTATTPVKEVTKAVEAPVKEATPVKTTETAVAKTTTPVPTKPATTATSEAGVTYKIQLGAFTTEPPKARFANAGKVSIELLNGLYKVTTATSFKIKEDAVKLRDQLQEKGYTGLFLVKFQNGQRIN